MPSIRTLRNEDAVRGEDIIVKKLDSPMYNKLGQIWKVSGRGEELRVSVSFDGEVYNFDLEDLILA